ncbi:fluoride efflux transporter CrcB [Cytobacillus sp. Hz8]|uniref:fluoride efflux transporter CrcB n=1 Tax=Cytobacillus sp. Hz8 TaxID=3347168 RepID=UPI0035DC8E25
MIKVLLISLGGFLGAICRLIVSNYGKKFRRQIPIGTLIVNLVGAFLLGFLMGASVNDYTYALMGTGFMGAFTTFSTLKVDGVMLWNQKQMKQLILYFSVTYIIGIGLAYVGFLLGKNF